MESGGDTTGSKLSPVNGSIDAGNPTHPSQRPPERPVQTPTPEADIDDILTRQALEVLGNELQEPPAGFSDRVIRRIGRIPGSRQTRPSNTTPK